MIEIKWDFYVKKMQKFSIVLFGVLWTVISLCGCTKKDEAQMMLLTLEEEAEAESKSVMAESENGLEAMPDTGAESVQTESQGLVPPEEVQPGFLYVHICGAVLNPGVYELPAGSRVYEVVEQAGGFTEDAAKDYVNQAQVVPDAAKIVIPTLQDVETVKADEQVNVQYGILSKESVESETQAKSSEDSEKVINGLVNLNTASKAELCALPGIGEAKADAIVEYRTQIGVFTSKEQIMEIEGIKDGLYSKIQDKICVE